MSVDNSFDNEGKKANENDERWEEFQLSKITLMVASKSKLR